MGSNISVVNKSNANLHVCLKQVTPLYFENYVAPGQALNREVGKFWFTIEAKLALGENEYSTGQSLKDTAIVSSTALLFPINPLLGLGVAGVVGSVVASGDGSVVSSPGWFLSFDRRVEIRSRVVDNMGFEDREAGLGLLRAGRRGRMEFYLVEVCPICERESKGKCRDC